MALKIYFRWKVTIISILFALCAVRLSYWQWTRHHAKLEYIKQLNENLSLPVVPLGELVEQSKDLSQQIYRRVKIEGSYDYDKEMILRNRRYHDQPGSFVITPLRLNEKESILVNRGFVPYQYSGQEERKKLLRPATASFIGILKESVPEKFLAPKDPDSGHPNPWVDGWLRINIPKIQNQFSYPLLPVYAEIMNIEDSSNAALKIIQGKSERDDMFFPSEKMHSLVTGKVDQSPEMYPIAVFDTVVPASRHFGYIFEWGFIALLSLLIGLVLQLRPPHAKAWHRHLFYNVVFVLGI